VNKSNAARTAGSGNCYKTNVAFVVGILRCLETKNWGKMAVPWSIESRGQRHTRRIGAASSRPIHDLPPAKPVFNAARLCIPPRRWIIEVVRRWLPW